MNLRHLIVVSLMGFCLGLAIEAHFQRVDSDAGSIIQPHNSVSVSTSTITFYSSPSHWITVPEGSGWDAAFWHKTSVCQIAFQGPLGYYTEEVQEGYHWQKCDDGRDRTDWHKIKDGAVVDKEGYINFDDGYGHTMQVKPFREERE